MAKQYGLILPGQQKRSSNLREQNEIKRPSIFDESSESDDECEFRPTQKTNKTEFKPSFMECRIARSVQQKALKEDPTIFQYDELYDEMENKREEEVKSKSKEHKPKYIGRLLETAERRKLEFQLRIERQVQKERETEGDEFKDKESFVTLSYRQKLEELRILEEEEKRYDYLENIGDVTKQKDLDGFYRHLYEQKIGESKNILKPNLTVVDTPKDDNENISYKPIHSGQQTQRVYRKRQQSSSDSEDAEVNTDKANKKKTHLSNNIDADSDFSIDSSSESETEAEDRRTQNKDTRQVKNDSDSKKEPDTKKARIDSTNIALNLDKMVKNEEKTYEDIKVNQEPPKVVQEEQKKIKVDKTHIWKKRTVGDAFEVAIKRYFERKTERSAG